MSIRIYYDEINFRVKGWRKAVKIIDEVIGNEFKISGDLNFILTTNESLRAINVKFLEHDYDTDVITFNCNEGNVINGEIYISIEMVKDNARNYNVKVDDEVFRVILHGVLHLVGFDDKTKDQKKIMRTMEDYWICRMNN